MEFKTGDYVEVVSDSDYFMMWNTPKYPKSLVGMKGIIRHIDPLAADAIGVEFDTKVTARVIDLYKHGKPGYCMWFCKKNLKVVSKPGPSKDKKLEIESITKELNTIFVHFNDGTISSAKCSPWEKFDAEKGIAMAIAKRVMGSDVYSVIDEYARELDESNKKNYRGVKPTVVVFKPNMLDTYDAELWENILSRLNK